MGLTGSREGTKKLPKMSLLKVYRDTIVPDLERKIVESTIFLVSKAVSRGQASVHGSQMMKGKELSKAVTSAFEDKVNLPAMSHGFSNHHQVVNSVLEYDGDDS